jgi:hypothetical protein
MYLYLVKQLALQQALAFAVTASPTNKPIITPTTAMIYRGPSACEDCPETVGRLLKEIYPNIHVIYAGPHEGTQINATTLRNVQVFAQGGGDGKLLDEPQYSLKGLSNPTRADMVYHHRSQQSMGRGEALRFRSP